MDGSTFTAHISYYDYPFAPATNETDPPILRVWTELRPYLLTKGYEIPEDITAPWLGSLYLGGEEDVIPKDGSNAIRAKRRSDAAPVIVKIIMQPSRELAIHQYLLSFEHPHNHTVPIIDSFPFIRYTGDQYLDWMIIVEPMIHKRFIDYSLVQLHGEVLVGIRQALEGLAFMHLHHVAHGDICIPNMYYMSGTTFKHGIPAHPAAPSWASRVWRPWRLFYLDFGLSVKLADDASRSCVPYRGGVIVPPEVLACKNARKPLVCDPFAADVYRLGRVLRDTSMLLDPENDTFYLVALGFPEGISTLLEHMTHEEPERRPSVHECLRLFHTETQVTTPRHTLFRILACHDSLG
ncbi:hypothetical protein BD626DRAFT_540620 [Schizophyllum amplum]|uniref:Protein kinase domain-containing protein n=1 Tax=Schizophyllum amplum TaxID=97359 RepID=A0A550BXZ1_9AGAR|nr:hypothetical protein BD626DRAFT_540620 [Auriculariopsis ampla]